MLLLISLFCFVANPYDFFLLNLKKDHENILIGAYIMPYIYLNIYASFEGL